MAGRHNHSSTTPQPSSLVDSSSDDDEHEDNPGKNKLTRRSSTRTRQPTNFYGHRHKTDCYRTPPPANAFLEDSSDEEEMEGPEQNSQCLSPEEVQNEDVSSSSTTTTRRSARTRHATNFYGWNYSKQQPQQKKRRTIILEDEDAECAQEDGADKKRKGSDDSDCSDDQDDQDLFGPDILGDDSDLFGEDSEDEDLTIDVGEGHVNTSPAAVVTPTTSARRKGRGTDSSARSTLASTGGWGRGGMGRNVGWGENPPVEQASRQTDTPPAAVVTPTASDAAGAQRGKNSWGKASASSSLTSTGGWGRSGMGRNVGWGANPPVEQASRQTESPGPMFRSPINKAPKLPLPEGVKMMGEDAIPPTIIEECSDHFLLMDIFGGGNVVIQKYSKIIHPIQKVMSIQDKDFYLVGTKLEKGQGGGKKFGACTTPEYIKAYYVHGKKPNSVQNKLEQLADFAELWDEPGKLASRMELLLSPAVFITVGGKKEPCVYKIDASKTMETIDEPENKSEGCGFVPKDMLVKFLRGGTKGHNANAVQVRVLSPELGLFKGMLVVKPGIDKIQLPLSMRKVAGTKSRKKGKESSFILFNNISPSQNTENLERFLNPKIEKPPTKSAENELRGLSEQMQHLLLLCGVKEEVLEKYNREDATNWEGRGHTSLVGVCDFSRNGTLPEGTVFIPGLFPYNDGMERQVLLTRSPCTEDTDLARVRVITNRPSNMKQEDWKDLCNSSFGIISFASPKNANAMSLPETINNSDLDGDRFCVIWDPHILDSLKDTNMAPGRAGKSAQSSTYNVGDEIQVWEKQKFCDGSIVRVCAPDVKHGPGERFDIKSRSGNERLSVPLGEIRERNQGENDKNDKWYGAEVVKLRTTKTKGEEVEIDFGEEWEREWKPFAEIKGGLYSHLLVNYAIEEGLLNLKKWSWANKYARDAEIVEIRSIKETSKNIYKAYVLYDGDAKLTEKDIEDIDIDYLSRYARNNNDDSKKDAKLAKKLQLRIKEAKKKWFETLQDVLVDLGSLNDHHLLVTRLNREYKNKNLEHCAADVVAFGRAYKAANDIGKHGGRVPLPSHLRDIIVKKKSRLNDFIKDI